MERIAVVFAVLTVCSSSRDARASELFAAPGPKVHASDGAAGWAFGQSVALQGDTLAVGAAGASAVYVYTRQGSGWVEQQTLRSAPPGLGDFGVGLALDGDTLAVSSHDSAIELWVREAGTWRRQATLRPAAPDHGGDFGSGLALQGDLLLVGAQFMGGTGVAYAFERSGDTWTQSARIVPADAQAGDGFSIALSLSGERMACGARFDDDTGPDAGSAYVFRKQGASWVQEAKLLPQGASFYYGSSLSLDGERLVVDTGPGGESWRFDGVGWVREALVPAPFHAVRGLSLHGDLLLVGDWLGGFAGRVYVDHFEHGEWVELLALEPADGGAQDGFGLSFALDGLRLAVGSRDDDDLGEQSGSAYLFDLYGSLAYGTELGGANIATLVGVGEPLAGHSLRFDVRDFSGAPPVYLLASSSAATTPFGNGNLLLGGERILLGAIPLAGGAGTLDALLPWPPGSRAYVQGVQRHPQYPLRVALSHGLELVLAP